MQRSGLVQWALEEPFLELLLLFGFDFLDLCFWTRTALRNTTKKAAKTGLYLQALLVKSKEDLPLGSAHRAVRQGSVWLSPGPSESPSWKITWKGELCIPRSQGSRVLAPHQPPPRHRFLEKGNSSLWLSPPHRINVPLGREMGSPRVPGGGIWHSLKKTNRWQLQESSGPKKQGHQGSDTIAWTTLLILKWLHCRETSASLSPTDSWANKSKISSSAKRPFRR